MIKANELRVGNWIYENYNGRFIETAVESIHDYGIDVSYWDGERDYTSYSELSGIPLTPEWLLRFGFDGKSNKMYLITFLDEKGETWEHCVCVGIDNRWGYHDENDNSSCNLVKKIDYVHQLQNLHFALTNEELILT